MTQTQRRVRLIRALLDEDPAYHSLSLPDDPPAQRQLLRALMNLRPPKPIAPAVLALQDDYLQAEPRPVTDLAQLQPVRGQLYLWQGDITTLRCGAIVNAANSGMTGCYQPCHNCIDNCIHTYAGMQLRLACAEMMAGQEEPTGSARLTPAFNLPCDYVLHTVGPIITGAVTPRDEAQLAACYQACLTLADRHHIDSVAFCCISTGVFRFPNDRAAQIAVATVEQYLAETHSPLRVIFDVFRDEDARLYRALLQPDEA